MPNRLWIIVLACSALGLSCTRSPAGETNVPITFSGGHETDRRDGGRPVVLVAAGLGVTPEVFREAFRGVTPARGRGPTGDEARKNKAALMRVLAPHGVTNDRLDEVSNYYRYQPQRGELWKTTPARGHAIVKEGKISQVVIMEGGSGYSSPPKATIAGFEGVQLKVDLRFEKDLKKNGAVSAITVVVPDSK